MHLPPRLRELITPPRSLASYDSTMKGRRNTELGWRRRWCTAKRIAVHAIGSRRLLKLLHETGAVYPCWGSDANDTPFMGWVETRPPQPDEEALRG